MVSEADYTWGLCYGYNETSWTCDGMIGMVNRSEVDFALGMSWHLDGPHFIIMGCDFVGPFFPTWNQSQYVDFSSMVTAAAYSIVIPLKIENDIWGFVYVLDYWVS